MWRECRRGAPRIRGTGAVPGSKLPLRYKRTAQPKALKRIAIQSSSRDLRYKKSWRRNPRF